MTLRNLWIISYSGVPHVFEVPTSARDTQRNSVVILSYGELEDDEGLEQFKGKTSQKIFSNAQNWQK